MCIFCKIINKEIPTEFLYEDDYVVSFLDIAPVNKGHLLIIPKKHYVKFDEVDENTLNSITKAMFKLTNAIKIISEDYNIISNNGIDAGQEVPHLHFHIIPRLNDDNFSYNWKGMKYENEEVKEYFDKIKGNI